MGETPSTIPQHLKYPEKQWLFRFFSLVGIIAVLAAFAMLATWVDKKTTKDYEWIFNQQQETAVQLASTAMQNHLESLQDSISHVALSVTDRERSQAKPETITENFPHLRAAFPELLTLGFYLTPKGPTDLAIAGSFRARRAERESHRWVYESWDRLKDRRSTSTIIPDLHISYIDRFIAFLVPVHHDDEFYGIVAAVANLDSMISDYVVPLAGSGFGEIFLLDLRGRFVFSNSEDFPLGTNILEFTDENGPVPSVYRLALLSKPFGKSIRTESEHLMRPDTSKLLAWGTSTINTQKLIIGVSADTEKVHAGFSALRLQRMAFAGILGLAFISLGIGIYRKLLSDRLSYQNAVLVTQQETSPDGILVIDKNLNATNWNKAYLHQWHLTEGDMSPKVREQTFAKIDTMLHNPGEIFQHFLWLCDNPTEEENGYEISLRDGRILERRSRGLFNEKGRNLGRVFWFRDITDRKMKDERLRETLREFEAIFDNSMVGVLYTKGDRTIARANLLLAQQFGYDSADELIGKTTRSIHVNDETYESFATTFINALHETGQVHAETLVARKDGTPFWAEFTGKAINPQDLRCGIIWVITDISERKKLEQLREDVEQIMRHDLKNPLHNVIYVPQLLREDGNLTPQQLRLVDELEKSGYRMLEMVNRSMDIYKMERGTYELTREPVDLNKVLPRIIADLAPITITRGVDIAIHRISGTRPDAPFTAYGEELLLYTMLANLIRNAVEAATQGETVSISLNDANGSIAIHNSAPVPKEIRDTFFDKLTTSGKAGGTGLGTYSARLIAETHGGCIGLDTSSQTGTTVTVKLPLWADAPSPTCD